MPTRYITAPAVSISTSILPGWMCSAANLYLPQSIKFPGAAACNILVTLGAQFVLAFVLRLC